MPIGGGGGERVNLSGGRILLVAVVVGAFMLLQRKQRRVSDSYVQRLRERRQRQDAGVAEPPDGDGERGRSFESAARADAGPEPPAAGEPAAPVPGAPDGAARADGREQERGDGNAGGGGP